MMKIDIRQLVDDHIGSLDNDRDLSAWHISSLGQCLGGAYFERMGKEPDYDFNPRVKRVFHVGNVFEEWILDLAEQELDFNYKLKRQMDLKSPNGTLTGHPDGVIIKVTEDSYSTADHEHRYEKETIDVWEVKTIHSNGFWHMDREGREGYDHHRLQLWGYLKLLEHPQGTLIYISKDDLSTRQFTVRLDDKSLEKAFAKDIKALNEALDSKTPPPVPTDPTDWRYQRCRYHSYCLESAGEDFFYTAEKTPIYKLASEIGGIEIVKFEDGKRYRPLNLKMYRKLIKEAENG